MDKYKQLDYKDLIQQHEQESKEQQNAETPLTQNMGHPRHSKFSLLGVKEWWGLADKKVKIEVIIFVLISISAISFFSYYIVGIINSKISRQNIIVPNQESDIMPENLQEP